MKHYTASICCHSTVLIAEDTVVWLCKRGGFKYCSQERHDAYHFSSISEITRDAWSWNGLPPQYVFKLGTLRVAQISTSEADIRVIAPDVLHLAKEGYRPREISVMLKTTPGSVKATLSKLRRMGLDVPRFRSDGTFEDSYCWRKS